MKTTHDDKPKQVVMPTPEEVLDALRRGADVIIARRQQEAFRAAERAEKAVEEDPDLALAMKGMQALYGTGRARAKALLGYAAYLPVSGVQ